MFLPVSILGMWLRGLFAVAVLGSGVYLLSLWYRQLPTHEVVVLEPSRQGDAARSSRREEPGRPLSAVERFTAWRPALDGPTAALAGGILLLAGAFAGRLISSRLIARPGGGEPRPAPAPGGTVATAGTGAAGRGRRPSPCGAPVAAHRDRSAAG